jgi:hypothetical protein
MALGLIEDFAEWAAQHDNDCALQHEMYTQTHKAIVRLGYTPPANAKAVWGKLLDLLAARAKASESAPAWDEVGVDFDSQIREVKYELCGEVAP